MSEQYHKMIHTDILRLRLLLTNTCNGGCDHCLNEYMPPYMKNKNEQYADTEIIKELVVAYTTLLKMNKVMTTPHVYLSGGEPTRHRDFSKIVSFISEYTNAKMTVCSNGNNWKELSSDGTYNLISSLHYSFGFLTGTKVVPYFKPIFESLDNWRQNRGDKDLAVAMVTKDTDDFELGLAELMTYQKEVQNKFVIKLWGDLRYPADHTVNLRYRELIEKYPSLINRGPVEHPVNRGSGCNACVQSCPTLKALWFRPDNTVSPCPQSTNWYHIGGNKKFVEIYNAVKFAYEFHFA